MSYSFRAWDPCEEVMRDHRELLADQRFYSANNRDYDIFDDPSYKVDMSLGIEDCEGIPIYENDIITTGISSLDGYGYLVLRNPATAGYVCKPFKLGHFGKKEPRLYSVALPTLDQLKRYNIKVIGNIHQNKELLEEQK